MTTMFNSFRNDHDDDGDFNDDDNHHNVDAHHR
jgi:hypothetical protein